MLPEAEKTIPIKKRYREHEFFGNVENVPANNQQYSSPKSPTENACYPANSYHTSVITCSLQSRISIIEINQFHREYNKKGTKLLTRVQESMRNSPYLLELDESGAHGLVYWNHPPVKFSGKLKMKWLQDYKYSNPEAAGCDNLGTQQSRLVANSEKNAYKAMSEINISNHVAKANLSRRINRPLDTTESTASSVKATKTVISLNTKANSPQTSTFTPAEIKTTDSSVPNVVVEEVTPARKRDRACKGLLYLGFIENSLIKKQRVPTRRQQKLVEEHVQPQNPTPCIFKEPATTAEARTEVPATNEPVPPRKRGRPKGSKNAKTIAEKNSDDCKCKKFSTTSTDSSKPLPITMRLEKSRSSNNTIEYAVVENKRPKMNEKTCRNCGLSLRRCNEDYKYMPKRTKALYKALCANCSEEEFRIVIDSMKMKKKKDM